MKLRKGKDGNRLTNLSKVTQSPDSHRNLSWRPQFTLCFVFTSCTGEDSTRNTLVEDQWGRLLRKCRELSRQGQGLQGGWRWRSVGLSKTSENVPGQEQSEIRLASQAKEELLWGESKHNTERPFKEWVTQCWHLMLLIIHFWIFFKTRKNVLFSRITLGEKARGGFQLPNFFWNGWVDKQDIAELY